MHKNITKKDLLLVTLPILILFYLTFTTPVNASTNLTLDYSETRVFGGAGNDQVSSIEEDSLKNLYIVGNVGPGTIDFDPGSGVDSYTSAGNNDFYLTKYNADGSYAWTKKWGGIGADNAYNIAFDSSNNIYVAAEFSNTVDLDPNSGTDSRTSAGSVDISLIKINPEGGYEWAKVMGSTSHDRLHSVQIASNNDIYIAGKFTGTVDFNPDSLVVDSKASIGNYDAYFTKFNADGSYAWTKTWGGTDRDTVNDFVIGADGNFYLAGVFRGTPLFNTDSGTEPITTVGLDDAFLTRYNADGSYGWTKTWGGTSNDFSFNIRTSPTNDIYIIGSYQLSVDFDPSGITNSLTAVGSEDSYMSKFGSDGSYKLTYTWGGSLMDELNGITFDKNGNYYVGGFFNGTIDFNPSSGTDNISPNGTYDHFFSVFDSNDNYISSKTFGSSTEVNWFDEILYDLYASDNKLYLGGFFNGTTDFNPGSGTDNYVSSGGWESYITTYILDSTAPTITSVSSSKSNGTYGVGEVIDINIIFSESVTSTGNVTVTLETGATDRSCTFSVSKSTTGTCNYTIQAGDTSSDLSIKSISGTIKDLNTNLMTNLVPLTGLESNKDIVVVTPSIVSSSSSSSKKTTYYSSSSSSSSESSESSSSSSEESLGKTVVIKVEDKDGNPVEGARVELHSDVQIAFTDKNGLATFSNVLGDTHEVVVSYGNNLYSKIISVDSLTSDTDKHYVSRFALIEGNKIGESSSNSSLSKTTQPSKSSSFPVWIIVIIMGVLIVGILFLVRYLFKQRSEGNLKF